MGLRILADENVTASVVDALDDAGHDVVTVAGTVGPGAKDAAVGRYAHESGRFVLTSDHDFVRKVGGPEDADVLFQPDDALPVGTVVEILAAVDRQVERNDVGRPVYVTEQWL